jgi:membrane-associated phospholipid phosphatase
LGAGLVLTRVVLLAHWASDVVAGLALGALVERLLRPLTGYGTSAEQRAGHRRDLYCYGRCGDDHAE